MDIEFTEAWYSAKSKQLVLFFCKEPPKTVLHYGIAQVLNCWTQTIPGELNSIFNQIVAPLNVPLISLTFVSFVDEQARGV